jgi:UDP-N-acetylglucosamine acyltransferase
MPQVHPSAIVGPDVQLADDVTVGPWCHLDGSITIGPGTRLLQRVSVQGPGVIGRNNTLYPNACVGLAPQDLKFDPAHAGAGFEIGDGNTIRESATIHRATGDTPTTLGNDNYMMVNSHIGHDCRVGNRVMFANNTALGGHVEVGDRVIFGGGAVVHQFCRIGRLAMLSGAAGVTLDVPPFCTVYVSRQISSLNLVGLRRADYRDHIKPLERAFRVYFRSKLPSELALERLHANADLIADPLVREFVEFIESSTRGTVPYMSKRSNAAGE